MIRLLLPLLLLTAASGPGATLQTNWPSFRGPGARGIGEGPATVTTWDLDASRNIRWKTPLPGLGHSSPVIWGDRLFVTTAVSRKGAADLKVGLYGDPGSSEDKGVQTWKVICLDKRTGAVLWDQTACENAPRQKRHPKATHANCTSATDGESIVSFFGSEGIFCHDLTGKLRWKKDWGTLRTSPVVYNGKPWPEGADLEWGFASSPILHNHRVYVQCDILTNGFVAALDAADGREIWRTRRNDTGTWSTPTVCLEGPRPQLLVNGWSHLGGYDLATGAEIWRMAGGGDCPTPTPVVDHGLIFLTSAHGPRKPIYVVRTDATGDVSLRDDTGTNRYVAWSTLRGGAYMQTPLIYEGRLYSCQIDGVLSCFEATTGKLLYKERLGTGGEGFSASPVACEGKLYFTSEQGNIFVVKPGAEFTVLATNRMGEACMATPAISDGVLYVRTQSRLAAIAEGR